MYCYKLESVIQQKQPRPHIFSTHLFLQLKLTENSNNLTAKSRLKKYKSLWTADERLSTQDEERHIEKGTICKKGKISEV